MHKNVIAILTIVVTGFIFCPGRADAQDFKKQFKKAKDIFQDGNMSGAMDAFKPLCVYDKNNPYPEYASFYYALSAQKLGFFTVAKDMFLQIKSIYPQWNQIDEVNYWLAKIYFDQGEYFQAMKISGLISNHQLFNDRDIMKRFYLPKIEDTEELKMVLEENPGDEIAALALANLLNKQIFPNRDGKLLDSIVAQYNFPVNEFKAPWETLIRKSKYRIALLMPFLAHTIDPGPEKKKNQPILDLYNGMKMALDTLSKQGIQIELLTYDTEHDLKSTERILQEGELRSADLIVGPIFSEETKPVQEFSMVNKINIVINPFSNNNELVAQNPYGILYQPSQETVGLKSAEWVARKIRNKKCMVFFGESPKDSVLAFSFIKNAIQLGVNVVYVEEIHKETSASILTTLASATEYDEWKNPTQFKLKRDSIGSIFVASDNPLIYTKVINSVETRGDSIVVMGQESWITDTSTDFSKFERVPIIFSSPNFTPVSGKAYSDFRKKFLSRHGVVPSDYATRGYEFMVVMGHALGMYGTFFQPGLLNGGLLPGELTSGYLLQPTKDNGSVPFVSFLAGQLIKID